MWGEIVLNLNSSLSSSRSSFINCKSLLAFHSPWIFQFCFVIKESWTSSIIVVNFKCRENQFTHATGKGTLSFVRLKFNKLDQWNSQSIVSYQREELWQWKAPLSGGVHWFIHSLVDVVSKRSSHMFCIWFILLYSLHLTMTTCPSVINFFWTQFVLCHWKVQ